MLRSLTVDKIRKSPSFDTQKPISRVPRSERFINIKASDTRYAPGAVRVTRLSAEERNVDVGAWPQAGAVTEVALENGAAEDGARERELDAELGISGGR